MSASDGRRRWPGFGQDREAERMEAERRQEQAIKARNLSARIRAADPVQRGQIDPAIGRTFGECLAMGLYDDEARLRDYRERCAWGRADREGFRWAQVRIAGREGRN